MSLNPAAVVTALIVGGVLAAIPLGCRAWLDIAAWRAKRSLAGDRVKAERDRAYWAYVGTVMSRDPGSPGAEADRAPSAPAPVPDAGGAAARALAVLGDDCPAAWRQVAEARIASPDASWADLGRQLGSTAAQVRGRYRRMTAAAGVP